MNIMPLHNKTQNHIQTAISELNSAYSKSEKIDNLDSLTRKVQAALKNLEDSILKDKAKEISKNKEVKGKSSGPINIPKNKKATATKKDSKPIDNLKNEEIDKANEEIDKARELVVLYGKIIKKVETQYEDDNKSSNIIIKKIKVLLAKLGIGQLAAISRARLIETKSNLKVDLVNALAMLDQNKELYQQENLRRLVESYKIGDFEENTSEYISEVHLKNDGVEDRQVILIDLNDSSLEYMGMKLTNLLKLFRSRVFENLCYGELNGLLENIEYKLVSKKYQKINIDVKSKDLFEVTVYFKLDFVNSNENEGDVIVAQNILHIKTKFEIKKQKSTSGATSDNHTISLEKKESETNLENQTILKDKFTVERSFL